jgi:predicted PurR-regulated permease PerM
MSAQNSSATHTFFSFLIAVLVTLTAFPVLGWHYYENLEGFALVGIAGLTLSDSVMLFCAYWQIKSSSNAERITALICKFLIAITVVTIAVLVIADSAAKKIAEKNQRINQESQLAQQAQKNQLATDILKIDKSTEGRKLAREAINQNSKQSTVDNAAAAFTVPTWLSGLGSFLIPPIISIICALVLSIVHQLSISVKTSELTETLTTTENLAENAENPAETSNILRIPRKKKR